MKALAKTCVALLQIFVWAAAIYVIIVIFSGLAENTKWNW